MVNPPIKNGNDLDWTAVDKAARGILKQAENAFYLPPEAVKDHTVLVTKVCEAMNAISDALKLRRANKHELTGSDDCSLFNSSHPHADGYVRISCGCGWQSNPIRSRDTGAVYQSHVAQALHEEK